MKKYRLLSLLLTLALLIGIVAPAQALSSGSMALDMEQVENLRPNPLYAAGEDERTHAPDEIVRVSILLDTPGVLEMGYSTRFIAENRRAMAYGEERKAEQLSLTSRIEALTGEKLHVCRSLTLTANLLSVELPYGRLDEIRALPGVRSVELEIRYEPEESPDTSISPIMTGSTAAWAAGYTGAGTRIAIIDTGIDTDHQSFDAAAFRYSLDKLAQQPKLLDTQELAGILDKLSIADGYTAEDLYLSEKIPFAFNYVDSDLDVTHDNDLQGEHGSHVAGIAAANAYIPDGENFVGALDAVKAVGVAPDAQLIVMKVFGKGGGAYDSDYMIAIEDAILLGCDAINLSLGAGSPGFSRSRTYTEILERLQTADAVVTISAGNAYAWADRAKNEAKSLYDRDVSFSTTGQPGSFNNSLSVASVDNVGFTRKYIQIGDMIIYYNEPTTFTNEPITTLAGEQEYIFLDNAGKDAQFKAVKSAVKGKVAFCSRGSTNFSKKATAATKYGAIATVVYNNTDGMFNMDLSDYTGTAPCINISQADAERIKAASTPVTDNDGKILYYTGTMTISTVPHSVVELPEYKSMSNFSSWGVPGSLRLKPEITAPGGNIWSVDGSVEGGKSYENMSGTSMAAPQMAGMVALVAQYIREKGLDTQTGLSVRRLAQSLLMSTATPLEQSEGSFWSVLKQGAGLANANDAISADCFLTMNSDATDSWNDGKIKAELGDDPERNGVYRFSFAATNLTQERRTYTLSSSLFTQGLFTQGDYRYLDTKTTALPAVITYTVDGKVFIPEALVSCDLNGDGRTDGTDAQIILNYAAGLSESIDPAADVNADGSIDSYDAYLILYGMQTGEFTLAPGASATVTVEITLPDTLKAELDENYVNGAYIEGYTFLRPVTTQEGVSAPAHSVPILGFYGNWSDPSMYDYGTYVDRLYGDETPTYTGVLATNALITRFAGLTSAYYNTVNNYLVEDILPEGRAAINAADTIYAYKFTLIRNAAALTCVITDESGRELYFGPVTTAATSAYYHMNSAQWRNLSTAYTIDKRVGTLDLAEGERFTVTLYAVPEYYEDGGDITEERMRALIASGELGKGVSLSSTLTVDNTDPELYSVAKDLFTGGLHITAKDNQYIAAVRVCNPTGDKVLAQTAVEQTEPGQTVTAKIDLSGVKVGQTCLVQVIDYAGNAAQALVTYGGEPEDYSGRLFAFTDSTYLGTGYRWVSVDPDKLYYNSSTKNEGIETAGATEIAPTAAEYVKGYLYAAANDGYLYVMKPGEWSLNRKVAWYGKDMVIRDMAYNRKDGKLYALDNQNNIYTVELLTGVMEKAFSVSITNPKATPAQFDTFKYLLSLAIDADGNFYSVNRSTSNLYSFLYRWTLDDVVDGEIVDLPPIVNEADAYTGQYSVCYGAMTYDEANDRLLFASSASASGGGTQFLVTFDLETGKAVKVNSTYYYKKETEASKLQLTLWTLVYIPEGETADYSTGTPTGLEIRRESVTVLQGCQAQIVADLYPWALTDTVLHWTSSDERVLTVSGSGMITAHTPGTATVTVTTNAQPKLTASCTVTVTEVPDLSLNALVYSPDGGSYWAQFNVRQPGSWQSLSEKQRSYAAGGFLNGMIYTHDGQNAYAIDPETFNAELVAGLTTAQLWSDATAAPLTSGGAFGMLATTAASGTKLQLIDTEAKKISSALLGLSFNVDPMAVLAYSHEGVHSVPPFGDFPAEFFYGMTESGKLYRIEYYNALGGYSLAEPVLLAETGLTLTGVSQVNGSAYASLHFDSASGYLFLSRYTEGNVAELFAIDPETGYVTKLGNFGADVWPVVSLFAYDRAAQAQLQLSRTQAEMFVDDDMTITARLIGAKSEQAPVWRSSDESIATVDENGRVTAHAKGSVIITAQVGEISASCAVTVLPLTKADLRFNAQLKNENGAFWASVSTADGITAVSLGEAKTALTGGGLHDGLIYGSNGDFKAPCRLMEVDPSHGFAERRGAQAAAGMAVIDAATAPALMVYGTDSDGNPAEATAFGMPVLLTADQSFFLLTNYSNGNALGWSNLWIYYNDLSAVAYIGQTEVDGNPAHQYLVLGANGVLHRFCIVARYNPETGAAAYELQRSVYGSLGRSFGDYRNLSMIYTEQNGHKGLLIAVSGEKAELYFADLSGETPVCGKLGNLDAQGATALYTDIVPSASDALSMQGVLSIDEAQVLDFSTPETPDSHVRQDEEDPMHVTITVSATDADGKEIPTHNGLLEIRYDPASLVLENIAASALHSAMRQTDGCLLLAYAGAENRDTAVTLTFRRLSGKQTDIEVTTKQANELYPKSTESITLSCLHESTELRDARPAGCDEDGYSGDLYCLVCGDLVKEGEVLPAHCASHESYTDVPADAWFHDAVDYVTEMGYMIGYGEGVFEPYGKLTRAELVQTLYRISGEHTDSLETPFTDVAEGAWYAEAVAWAYQAGIVNGMTATTFEPNAPATREQVVCMIYRFPDGEAVTEDHLAEFADRKEISDWALEAMNWAVANGLVIGTDEGKLNPRGRILRCEFAQIIARFSED